MISVTIIDDHKILLEGFERLINQSKFARIVSKGTCAADCRALLERELPDVLILDVKLPDGNGCDLCAELLKAYPSLKILMLTSLAEISTITCALNSGALGYVLKSSSFNEMCDGIYAVASGQRFLCKEVSTLLATSTERRTTLTGREREVLKLIVNGKTYTEIARELKFSNQTAKDYRSNLILKLNARNTAELVKIAIDRELV